MLMGKVDKQLQRLNEEAAIKGKYHSVVDVCDGESKVQCCKNQLIAKARVLGQPESS